MLHLLADVIFPKRCVGCKKIGSYLCDNCFSNIELFQGFVCPMCLRSSATGETHPSCITPLGLDGLSSGVLYKGVVKRLLHRFKHKPFLLDMGATIRRIHRETISQNELFIRVLYSHPIVVAVPLFPKKLKTRGYNQAEILGKSLAREFNIEFRPKILTEIKSTKPQCKLNKEERKQNVQGAFEVSSQDVKQLKGKTVLLVDDMSSSCATLRECAKVLKKNGAKKVFGVTFAREL